MIGLLEGEWGEGRTRGLLDEIYEILGQTLEDWLAFEFFPYHLSLYKNRPIFWLLWCGAPRRKRAKPTFACFLHYHKLTPDTLPKVRALYLGRVLQETRARLENLRAEYLQMDEAERNSPRGKRIFREREEAQEALGLLEEFDEKLLQLARPLEDPKPPEGDASWLEQKIHEVRVGGYRPDLDHGVLVNIAPLKEAGLLHRAAERVK